jgi:hypothetical protein
MEQVSRKELDDFRKSREAFKKAQEEFKEIQGALKAAEEKEMKQGGVVSSSAFAEIGNLHHEATKKGAQAAIEVWTYVAATAKYLAKVPSTVRNLQVEINALSLEEATDRPFFTATAKIIGASAQGAIFNKESKMAEAKKEVGDRTREVARMALDRQDRMDELAELLKEIEKEIPKEGIKKHLERLQAEAVEISNQWATAEFKFKEQAAVEAERLRDQAMVAGDRCKKSADDAYDTCMVGKNELKSWIKLRRLYESEAGLWEQVKAKAAVVGKVWKQIAECDWTKVWETNNWKKIRSEGGDWNEAANKANDVSKAAFDLDATIKAMNEASVKVSPLERALMIAEIAIEFSNIKDQTQARGDNGDEAWTNEAWDEAWTNIESAVKVATQALRAV